VPPIRKRRQQPDRLLFVDPRGQHRFALLDERGCDWQICSMVLPGPKITSG